MGDKFLAQTWISVFRKFKLLESFRNRVKMLLLNQEMNFKKNPIEKNQFFLAEKSFWKKSC